MTNKLADAYDLLAEAYATLALELRNPAVEKGGPAPVEELPFDDDLPAIKVHPDEWERQLDAEPHGSAAVCPAHGVPYEPQGKWGPYCQQPSSDPEWSNAKGFCRITPKNAAAYLRQKAAR